MSSQIIKLLFTGCRVQGAGCGAQGSKPGRVHARVSQDPAIVGCKVLGSGCRADITYIIMTFLNQSIARQEFKAFIFCDGLKLKFNFSLYF